MTDDGGTDMDETEDPEAFDALLDDLLAGRDPATTAPPWCSDVALLVRAAQAPARPDELAAEADIVQRMHDVRVAVRAGTAPEDPSSTPQADEPPPPAVGDLDERRARHSERGYRAKHAAARLERSRHPAVRTLGRVVAMKAVAVTTAAVVSVAAAAATTGIVATVVVPAFSGDPAPRPSPPAETTDVDEKRPDRVRTPAPSGTMDPPAAAACPMLPACEDTRLPAPQADDAAPVTPPATSATTVPDASTSAETTTTTATPPSTTVPPSTTTTAPTPSTTIPSDPPPDPGPGPIVALSDAAAG